MSQAIVPIKSVKAIDPRVDFAVPDYLIHQGASDMSFRVVNAQSVSNASVNFTCPPPNVNVAVDRKVYIEMLLRLTFTGDSGDDARPLIELGTNDGPRSYPLSKICNSISVILNNQTVTTTISDYADALLHYNNELNVRQFELSSTPSMLDTMQDYRQYVGCPEIRELVNPSEPEFLPPPAAPNTPNPAYRVTKQSLGLGSARNPMASYGENSTENSRGGFSGVKVIEMTRTRSVIDLTIIEPLFLSPLLFGDRDSMGLYGIQAFDITLNMGTLSRCWSHVPPPVGTTLTGLDVQLSGQTSCKAHFCYLTPQINQILSPDSTYSYPYYQVERFQTDISAQNPGSSFSATSNSLQLATIPRRVYVFARRKNANQITGTNPYQTSDTYARLDSIQVTFNNRSGLLSTAQSYDLYHMCVRNGLQSSWDQWNKYQGSILCIDAARDMSLGPLDAPGVQGQYNFYFTANFTDLRPNIYSAVGLPNAPPLPDPMEYTLFVVTVSEGAFTVKQQTTIQQIGIVSPADVLNDPSIPRADYYNAMRGANFYGGAFMDTVKKYGKKALVGLNSVLPALSAAAPFLPGSAITGPVIKGLEHLLPKLIGAGLSESEARKICGGSYSSTQIKEYIRHLKGRGVTGGSMIGGADVGGRMASKNRLARHLRG